MNIFSLIRYCIYSLVIVTFFFYKQVRAEKYPVSFICINHQNTVKTVVDTYRGRIELITWKNKYYSSEIRLKIECQKASEILQQKYDEGEGKTLYIISDVWNWGSGDNGLICIFNGREGIRRRRSRSRFGKFICDNKDILISLPNQEHKHGGSVMKDFFEPLYKVESMSSQPDRVHIIYDLIKYLELAPIIDRAAPLRDRE